MTRSSALVDYRHIAGGYSSGKPITVCVHCFYEEITTQGFLFSHANASIGHNLLKPWVELYQYGLANGLRFVTADQVRDLSAIDAVIFSDRPAANDARAQQLLALAVPKYLCLFETEVIKPDNWDRSYHSLFNKVFTMLDDWVDNVRYFKLPHALEPHMALSLEQGQQRFAEQKLCTLIAGAKLTAHPNELYSARIRTIEWMQTHAAADFDLYGFGWPQQPFPSYRGSISDKLATMAQYRFAICYENARNFPGYITEKIFDCLVAGTVPVYWGAPNIADWVPADCFIDRTQFASEEALYAHLKNMPAQTHAVYQARIAAFLDSAAFYPFSIENFITTLTAHVAKDVRWQRGDAPQVSVCIPNYNYGRYIEQAVDSALEQEVERLEMLVFDNHSSDDSAERLKKYASNPRVRVMRNTRNWGSDNNWYNAYRCAAGTYLTILSADDFFLRGHLAPKLQCLEQNPQAPLAYCPCMQVNGEGQALGVSAAYGHADQDYVGGRNEAADLLTYDSYITPSAAIVRRSSFETLGWTPNRRLHGAGDWELWIRMAEKFPDFAFLHEATVCYRTHTAQHTQELLQSAKFLEDHLRILEGVYARGAEALLHARSAEIAALLWGRFLTTAPGLAQPHQAAVQQVEVRLLNACLAHYVAQAPSVDWRNTVTTAFGACLQGSASVTDVINAAQSLLEGGHRELAAALYRTWVTHHSGDDKYIAAYNLAVLMHQAGDVRQALMYYSRTLQMQPAFDQGRLALADLLLARHRKAEALAQLRWLMQPNNGAAARTPDILLQAHARLVAM